LYTFNLPKVNLIEETIPFVSKFFSMQHLSHHKIYCFLKNHRMLLWMQFLWKGANLKATKSNPLVEKGRQNVKKLKYDPIPNPYKRKYKGTLCWYRDTANESVHHNYKKIRDEYQRARSNLGWNRWKTGRIEKGVCLIWLHAASLMHGPAATKQSAAAGLCLFIIVVFICPIRPNKHASGNFARCDSRFRAAASAHIGAKRGHCSSANSTPESTYNKSAAAGINHSAAVFCPLSLAWKAHTLLLWNSWITSTA
jgi:hypothetical protein